MQLQSNSCPMEPMAMMFPTVGNTIQTVNSPMYDTYMSTPGNSAKLGATRTQQLTDSTKRSILGWERTYNALVSILMSQHSIHYASLGMEVINLNNFGYNVRVIFKVFLQITSHIQRIFIKFVLALSINKKRKITRGQINCK